MKTKYKNIKFKTLLLPLLSVSICNAESFSRIGKDDLIMNSSELNGRFGKSLTYGDFNGDGFTDLAIGNTGDNYSLFGTPFTHLGSVHIINGTSVGLDLDDVETLIYPIATDLDMHDFDGFGEVLESGDFNCDGITDLAVGLPFGDVVVDNSLKQNAGKVFVFNGLTEGLSSQFVQVITIKQNFGLVSTSAIEDNDFFGFSLAAGNFNGDSNLVGACDDLAIGAPGEDSGSVTDFGFVNVFYGNSLFGLEGSSRQLIGQATILVPGTAGNGDNFGYSLAAGNFSNNEYDDLAIGVPFESEEMSSAGAVNVIYGGDAGLLSFDIDAQFLSQANVAGTLQSGDEFGKALATGNLNTLGGDELVVGSPGEDIGFNGFNRLEAGAVHVIFAVDDSLLPSFSQLISRDTEGVNHDPATGGHFGSVISIGDIDNDNKPDLIVGEPDITSGRLLAVYGVSSGVLDPSLSLSYSNFLDFEGGINDDFSKSLIVADFGLGRNNLIVGLPGDTSSDGDTDAGSLMVFDFPNDIIFKDSFE